ILALAADTPPAPDVIETAMRLDPGKPLAALSAAATAAPGSLLERAAGHATRGVALTLFVDPPRARAGELRLLAREFAGDLSPDPGSLPAGTPGWAFVRGSDLGLRIVLAGP